MESPQVKNDEHLIAAARAGDKAAFGDLVRLYQHEVYTLALRLTSDPQAATDVAQESFIRAWKGIDRFRGDAAFGTWIYRITSNVAWTHRNRRRRRATVPLSSVGDVAGDGVVTPEASAVSRAMRQPLARALSSLPSGQRMVVVLKDVYEWTHPEIAEHLGITVSAAKVRLHRGRKELKRLLWSEA